MYRFIVYTQITLLLLLIFLNTYIRSIATWQTHPMYIIFLGVFWIVFIVFQFYIFKISKTEPFKEAQKKYLIKRVQKGMLHYIVLYGTLGTILFPLVLVLVSYIENPIFNFSYHYLWPGLLGYPFAYLMWIVEKKNYDKLK
ncbi:MAG: hypothetical protein Q8L85_09530 [Alphaproteobacteria bacterium]|nr:hypothetical protein [Alphaproteobacteria bacterium]